VETAPVIPGQVTDILFSAVRMDRAGYETYAHEMRLVVRSALSGQGFSTDRINEVISDAYLLEGREQELTAL